MEVDCPLSCKITEVRTGKYLEWPYLLCSFYAIGGATQCAEIDSEAAIGDTLSSYCSIVLEKQWETGSVPELGSLPLPLPHNHKDVLLLDSL